MRRQIPIGAAHISFSGHTQMRHRVGIDPGCPGGAGHRPGWASPRMSTGPGVKIKMTLEFPRGGAAQDSSLDQHSEEHWPGGVKIKMTLESTEPKGKGLGCQMKN